MCHWSTICLHVFSYSFLQEGIPNHTGFSQGRQNLWLAFSLSLWRNESVPTNVVPVLLLARKIAQSAVQTAEPASSAAKATSQGRPQGRPQGGEDWSALWRATKWHRALAQRTTQFLLRLTDTAARQVAETEQYITGRPWSCHIESGDSMQLFDATPDK